MGHRTVIVFALSLAAPHASLSAEKHLAGEFGAFGGGVFGTGNHGVAGGSVGAAFNKRWAVLFEYSHLRMGSAGYSERAPLRIYEFQGISNSRANHFSLGTHFNLPARGRRFIPVGLRGPPTFRELYVHADFPPIGRAHEGWRDVHSLLGRWKRGHLSITNDRVIRVGPVHETPFCGRPLGIWNSMQRLPDHPKIEHGFRVSG